MFKVNISKALSFTGVELSSDSKNLNFDGINWERGRGCRSGHTHLMVHNSLI
jgi:hypothetical protein